MDRQQRLKLMEHQTRAFLEGTVEYINDEWVFFDHETEEASSLDEYFLQAIEVMRYKDWKEGILLEKGKVRLGEDIFFLKVKDTIRIRKHLPFSFERLLEEISDDAFFQFISVLNKLQFSIYDCLYCYNHFVFTSNEKRKTGVNFIIFDNQDFICSVQHHFYYFEKRNDRFEFTINTGKRVVVEKISRA
ncbi:DUF2777 domain-containing protein [Bacillaceae bacterium Marseille-Q3522]|nr:DUF2777 domain-containing protein [Bacillaceae bacterium Marseille-Q3522]